MPLAPGPVLFRTLAGIALGAIYLTVILMGLVLQFIQHYLMQWTAQRAMYSLRRELMLQLQRLDIAFFDRNPVGRLVTRVTTDVDTLSELFASGLVSIAADLCLLGFVIFAMLFLIAAFLTTPMYRAETTLQIERQNPEILNMRDVAGTDYTKLVTAIEAYEQAFERGDRAESEDLRDRQPRSTG